MFENISKTPVFEGLRTSEIMQLLNTTHYQIRSYNPEDFIACSGANCENLYLLIEGSTRGEMFNYNGKNIVVSEIHAPDTFAEGFLFANKNKLLINIIAQTNAKILVIYKNDFLNLLSKNKRILDNYLNITSNRFVILAEKIKFLMIKSVKIKLANYLLDLEKENADKASFRLGKTHKELATLFGITRPVLTKNLLELKNDSIIEIKNKQIKIIDRKKLLQNIELMDTDNRKICQKE
ncbi:MAG: Crp/Fnr family transcriptional regulator [Bacteroidales bacterium]|nr:Crp/Fnr family transcriptional regulator [Bacteroidales bacterium]